VAAFADDDLVTPAALGPFLLDPQLIDADAQVLRSSAQSILRLPIDNKLEAIEEALIAEAVRLSDGNKSGAARLLGMHRKAVSRRL
jgi:DNA-binding NtrC family response regulator